jgi:acetyltransferase-like isoleucine patch superfamily enzyme
LPHLLRRRHPPGDSHSILDGDTGKRFNYAEDVLIADHVWIGAGCAILKGALISSETVVGTGSVVTGKFT